MSTHPPGGLEPPDLPARLGQLADSVEGLRAAVDQERHVREQQIDAANRAHRRSTGALVVAIAAALVGALVSLMLAVENGRQSDDLEQLLAERATAAVRECRNGNVARADIRDGFNAYTDALVAVAPATPRTADQQAAFDQRVAAFRADLERRLAGLAPQDCSYQALGFPTPDEKDD